MRKKFPDTPPPCMTHRQIQFTELFNLIPDLTGSDHNLTTSRQLNFFTLIFDKELSFKCSPQKHNGKKYKGKKIQLTRSGQIMVGSGQVRYQIKQLNELNLTMYHTWGWGVRKKFSPQNSMLKKPKNNTIKIDWF